MTVRKQNGEGSIIHDTAGGRNRWIFQYCVYNAQGKRLRKSITRRTKSELLEAKKALDEANSNDKTAGIKTNDITVDDWLNHWLNCIKPSVKPGTFRFYKSLLKHVTPIIRKKQIKSVEMLNVQQMLNYLLESGGKAGQGLASKTIRSLRTTLISCFECAVDNGFLSQNVVKKTKPPRLLQKEIQFLSIAQAQCLLDVAERGDYLEAGYRQSGQTDLSRDFHVKRNAMIIRLNLATGMRKSEIFALCNDDISFEEKSVYIHQALIGRKISDVKTRRSVRRISVDEETINQLMKWLKFLQDYAQTLGTVFQNQHGLIFPNKIGKPVDVDTFRRRYFLKIIRAAGLPDGVTMHSLRHTHATLLLQAGVDVKTVSERLGHSTESITLHYYCHVTSKMEETAADVMGKLLNNSQSGSPEPNNK